jgi:flavin-dependent dehydrogenase
VLVTGDAAGSIEPFTGEGMSLALATGLIAARTILEGGDADAYARSWRSSAQARLRACRALAAIAARDGPRDAALSLLERAPALARALVTWTRTRPVAGLAI